MNIKDINKNWTELGNDDPMWVVLTDPAKKGNRWQEEDFFATGKEEIKKQFAKLDAQGISVRNGKALDFGCGVGRLTQALASRFEQVDGVDVSDSMIRNAEKLNRFPGRAKYHLNARGDLESFPSGEYDFIYSIIALQHIPPAFQKNYIADFMRLLSPGGIASFQTVHFKGWRNLIPDWMVDSYRKFKHKGKAFIPMYGVNPGQVRQIVVRGDGSVLKHDCVPYGGFESRLANDIFVIQKAPGQQPE